MISEMHRASPFVPCRRYGKDLGGDIAFQAGEKNFFRHVSLQVRLCRRLLRAGASGIATFTPQGGRGRTIGAPDGGNG